MKQPNFLKTLLGAFLILAVLVSCSPGANTPSQTIIRVASKDFTEQFILGEMYAQLLEYNGFKVERKLNLGGTPIAQKALESNEIDLYPEYTGTGLLTVLKLPVNTDPVAVYNTVKNEYASRFNLVWLDPAPMNNTQAVAMKRTRAQDLGIETVSDLVAQASNLVMVGPPEFQEREDGLPGMRKVYGDFNFKEYKSVDPGLRYQAINEGQADVTVAFGTDGEIAAFDLVILKDDKGLWPPYQVAPVIRKEVLDSNPKIAEILNGLAPLLTDEVMQQLNFEVSGKQREPADVAKEFLQQQGLIK
ncbi:periplasmic glycine betaine/choline-binding (lipo)protein of an ABC-type transport system [Bellilinea caldifistulae]|uniref:Quaternary ammonium transporter n=1 Tax=Bellilinea caldifistulae TaxID=360411 RepID=A0A0P6XDW6_9CHLR|nr:glycine betaine ABC transporter substrate-binding protein [Bellilinea caldifistulae]KPL73043.1 quaternary ammonium transporter [Bellilinea caldifistulae]GAP10971.1 periplasmic glycine betaine/choline-binding (lipo)protein of an ABC-type transport system [Bellilinea caldifistulae]